LLLYLSLFKYFAYSVIRTFIAAKCRESEIKQENEIMLSVDH